MFLKLEPLLELPELCAPVVPGNAKSSYPSWLLGANLRLMSADFLDILSR
jgi:hypothetical protein